MNDEDESDGATFQAALKQQRQIRSYQEQEEDKLRQQELAAAENERKQQEKERQRKKELVSQHQW